MKISFIAHFTVFTLCFGNFLYAWKNFYMPIALKICFQTKKKQIIVKQIFNKVNKFCESETHKTNSCAKIYNITYPIILPS